MQFSNKLNDIIDSATPEKTIKISASQVRRNPLAQFSINNVHKRGLKHHHFISFHFVEIHG